MKREHIVTDFMSRLEHWATVAPDKTALICLDDGDNESVRLSYSEFVARAQGLGEHLRGQALQGERALIMLPMSAEYAVAVVGCAYAGVLAAPAYLPTNGHHAERLARIARDSSARVALTTTKAHDTLSSRFERAITSTGNTRLLFVDHIQPAHQVSSRASAARDVMYLQYTSGSTGDPRGVIISRGNIEHYFRCWQKRFDCTDQEVFVSWLPLFHDLGLIMGLLQPLWLGATAVLMPPPAFLHRPARWLTAITRYRGTVSPAPNFAYELCNTRIDDEAYRRLELSSWRIALNGAEPIRAETLERFRQRFGGVGFREAASLPAYGLAESTLAVTTAPPGVPRVARIGAAALRENRFELAEGDDARFLVSCGPALPGVKLKVVDPVTGAVCPTGRVGEIWVAGGTIALGYWRRREETEATFRNYLPDGEGPFLRTGDLGLEQDGEIYITGRLKDTIVVYGQNYYPQDLEHSALESHPALAGERGAAFSVDVKGVEGVVLVLEVKRTERRKLKPDEVVKAVRTVISEAHGVRLSAVVLVSPATIKLTSSGKIQRRACKQSYLDGSLQSIHRWTEEPEEQEASLQESEAKVEPRRSRTTIVEWLSAEIARRGRLDPAAVKPSSTFSEYGLDSLDLAEIAEDLAQWLGKPLDATALFDYPSPATLAAALSTDSRHLAQDRGSLASVEPRTSQVAIVGMGCSFPEAPSIERFAALLREGRDAIRLIPETRWKLPSDSDGRTASAKWGGVVDDVEQFDALFFGISPREAEAMDPQQRLLLATVWHALEDAGIVPSALAGSNTGVFVGIATNDYRKLQLERGVGTDPYSGTGTCLCIAANRVSYLLDLRGPSWAVDTACSSALVALHQARQSIVSGECEIAIVAGVNLILTPDLTEVFSNAQMLAPDGRCKTFDASADGYVRGEGCGVLILRRYEEALESNARIHAILAGTAVGQDGRSNGLTAPNGLAQERVLRQALASAGLGASEVGYLEAHGTGTPLGDPIEVSAIKSVYGASEPGVPPLWIGSVKTNIGHLEAAAGVAGVIKAVLALREGQIPAHLNLKELNPAIHLEGSRCRIVGSAVPWKTNGHPRAAGISSFGFGGTNAHAIVREYVTPAASVTTVGSESPSRRADVLTISAKSAESLRASVGRYCEYLETCTACSWNDTCRETREHREHFAHRVAVVATGSREAAGALRSHLEARPSSDLFSGVVTPSHQESVAVLFTGQGSQYFQMGAGLYRTHSEFRQVLERCDAVFRSLSGRSLVDALYELGHESELDQTDVAQPALYAVEYGLWRVLSAAGIAPDYLLGHSLGEYVAAAAAGVFSMEDGLRLVAHRGRLMQERTPPGSMLAVGGSPELLPRAVDELVVGNGRIGVAAYNSPASIVLSGDSEALHALSAELERRGFTCTPLQVTRAFHSPLMTDMLSEYARCVEAIPFALPRTRLISNVTGEVAAANIATREYWVQHVMAPVRFGRSVETLARLGCRTAIELGPKATLIGLARQTATQLTWLPSLRKGADDREQIDRLLAGYYTSSGNLRWRDHRHGCGEAAASSTSVNLPLYPFERTRYWVPAVSTRGAASASGRTLRGVLGAAVELPGATERRFEGVVNLRRFPALGDHVLNGEALLPAAATLEAMSVAVVESGLLKSEDWVLGDIKLESRVVLHSDEDTLVHTVCEPTTDGVTVRCLTKSRGSGGDWSEFATCTALANVRMAPLAAASDGTDFVELEPDWYRRFEHLGMSYGPSFRGLVRLRRRESEAEAEIEVPTAPSPGAGAESPSIAALDSCLHGLVAFVAAATTGPVVPVRVERFVQWAELPARVRARLSVSPSENDGDMKADVDVSSESGERLAAIRGLRLSAMPRDAATTGPRSAAFEAYALSWREHPVSAAQSEKWVEPWVVLTDHGSDAERWRSQCAQAGIRVISVSLGSKTSNGSEDHLSLEVEPEANFRAFFERLHRRHPVVAGIVLVPRSEPGGDDVVVGRAHALARRGFLSLQAFIEQYSDVKPAVVLCSSTLGAPAVGVSSLEHSVLTGLARAVTAEFPSLPCVQVDLDGSRASASAPRILEVARAARGSARLAWRAGQWFEATLTRLDQVNATGQKPKIDPEATYLITGASGGLAGPLATWLASQGARALVLSSRRALQNVERFQSLSSLGVRIETALVDVSDYAACERVVEQVRATMPPLKGVFHSAGVLDDAALGRLSWERFQKVLRPKVDGGWNLHRVTARDKLDHFVLFSSMASLVGSAGQASYVTANAFMDALATHRRMSGLPAVAVNWGPWSEVGMAADRGVLSHLARRGILGIAPDDALRALGEVLAAGEDGPDQIGIAILDWSRAVPGGADVVRDRLTAAAATSEYREGADTTFVGAIATRLLELEPAAAASGVIAELFERVARVLRLDPEQQAALQGNFESSRLNEAGLDSLMAMDLRGWIKKDYGVDVPVQYFIGGSTAGEVARLIVEQVTLRHLLGSGENPDSEGSDREEILI